MNRLLPYLLPFSLLLPATDTWSQSDLPIPYSNTIDHRSNNVISNAMNLDNLSSSSLFTGSTSVSVPLYDYSRNNIDLGIGLLTNTKGVKFSELSGSYGLHWSLKGGGYIIRHIRDIDDHTNKSESRTVFNEMYGKLEADGITDPLRKYIDGEYDEYEVAAGSYRFSFYMGNNGYIFVTPDHDVKIEQSGDAFTLTDIYGNRYHFEYAVQQSVSKQLFYGHNSSMGWRREQELVRNRIWTLSQVTFPNGEAVSFSYLPFNTSYDGYYYSHRAVAVGSHHIGGTSMVTASDQVQVPVLQEVTYPNNDKVTLYYHTANRCDLWNYPLLHEVRVTTVQESLKAHYKMHYSSHVAREFLSQVPPAYYVPGMSCFYEDPNGPFSPPVDNWEWFNYQAYYRLLLDSVNMHCVRPAQCSGETLPYYKFEYNGTDKGLPSRTAAQKGYTDYWGYYNGTFAILFDLPADFTTISNHTRSYAQHLDSMKIYSLKSVTDPLGLRVEYEYDMHQANTSVHNGNTLHMGFQNPDPDFGVKLDNNRVIGRTTYDGLRLRRIKIQDPTMPGNNTLRKEFLYSKGMTFTLGGVWHLPLSVNDTLVMNQRLSYSPLVQGSNVGYSEIEEQTFNGSNTLLGSRITHFSNVVTIQPNGTTYENHYIRNGNTHYFEPPFTAKQYLRDYKIGLVLKETEKDDKGYTISEKEISYQFFEKTFAPPTSPGNKKIRYRDSVIHNLGNPFGSYMEAEDNYSIFSGKAAVSDIKERKYYSATDFAEDHTTYTYDGSGNLIREMSYPDNDNYFYIKQYFYPRDFITAPDPSVRDMADLLVDRNILNETGYRITKHKAIGMDYLVTDASFHTYALTGNDDPYISASSRLKKGNRDWLYGDYTVAEKDHAASLMLAATDQDGYRSEGVVMQTDDRLRPLEVRHRGVSGYGTFRYDPRYQSEIAACNTAYNDFIFLPFEWGTAPDQVSYPVHREHQGNYLWGPLVVRPQSGNGVLLFDPGASLEVTGLSGNKTYIVSCWVHTGSAGTTTLLKVQDGQNNDLATLQPSNNYTYYGWHYYQAEVPLAAAGGFTLRNTGSSQDMILDNVVVAPRGATYSIKSYNGRGETDMEGSLNGVQVRYEYDGFGRLDLTRDQNANVTETYHYHLSR